MLTVEDYTEAYKETECINGLFDRLRMDFRKMVDRTVRAVGTLSVLSVVYMYQEFHNRWIEVAETIGHSESIGMFASYILKSYPRLFVEWDYWRASYDYQSLLTVVV